MPFFIVTMTHPDGTGWDTHLADHVHYLKQLVSRGSLRASGPLKGTPKRAGFLVFEVPDRDEADALIADDPFAREKLIESLSVTEWDPLFGAFADASSGKLPGFGATG